MMDCLNELNACDPGIRELSGSYAPLIIFLFSTWHEENSSGYKSLSIAICCSNSSFDKLPVGYSGRFMTFDF